MSVDNLGPIVIGPREIWTELSRLRTAVERMSTQAEGDGDRHRDVEARLRSLERSRWSIASLSTVIALTSLAIAAYLALRP